MTVAVDTAREAILAQLEPLQREYAEAKARLDAIEESKAQLEAALRALSPGKKPRSKAGRKASKPYARKSDVQAVCLSLVKDNPAIAKDELEELAKHTLAEEQGFSLSGVSLRLSECLASGAFNVGETGTVTLAQTASKIGSCNQAGFNSVVLDSMTPAGDETHVVYRRSLAADCDRGTCRCIFSVQLGAQWQDEHASCRHRLSHRDGLRLFSRTGHRYRTGTD